MRSSSSLQVAGLVMKTGFSLLGRCLYEAMPVVAVYDQEETANNLQRTQLRTLDTKSPSERTHLRISQDREYHFLLGWAVLFGSYIQTHHKQERLTTWNWVRILHTGFFFLGLSTWPLAKSWGERGQAAFRWWRVPASHAPDWEAIAQAKNTGCLNFNPKRERKGFQITTRNVLHVASLNLGFSSMVHMQVFLKYWLDTANAHREQGQGWDLLTVPHEGKQFFKIWIEWMSTENQLTTQRDTGL